MIGKIYGTLQDMQRVVEWKKRNPYKIIAQSGGQNDMLSKDVDVLIGGGSRGGSKTFSLLLEALYDVYKKNFRAILFRNEIGDCVLTYRTLNLLIKL